MTKANSTLAEFLLARVDEDAATARDAWEDNDGNHQVESGSALARHMARHSPARVLVACEAVRQIVENTVDVPYEQVAALAAPEPHAGEELLREHTVGEVQVFERVLRYLALPYADHPDYDVRWRP